MKDGVASVIGPFGASVKESFETKTKIEIEDEKNYCLFGTFLNLNLTHVSPNPLYPY